MQIHSSSLPQSGPAARRRGAGRRGRLVGGADRRRAAGSGPAGLPRGRAARPAAAQLPRPGLLLVARRARQVGRRGAAARRRARHDRGQRRARRPHRRLPRPRRQRHDAARAGRGVRRRHDALRARPRAQHRATATRTTSSVLDEADAYVARNGLDLPEEPEARDLRPRPGLRRPNPILELDLAAAGVTSIVWATGFAVRLQLAAGRRVRRRTASRSTSAACRPSPASTSSACRGSRDADRPSSGACGTTPGTSPTRSRSSAATSPTSAAQPELVERR